MGWVLGSEDYDGSGPRAVPAGTCHAVDLDDGITACGRPVRSLRLWSEVPWRRAGMLGLDRCRICDNATWTADA